ncbi:ANTAR domain protein [Mycobacterium intracellulare subsp. chimaera]|nr:MULTISPECIES: GAF and ANTAR domain-containing protein [Mycobacterium]KLO34052.1 ANTAR domain protein [Mycobacterium nebraskense]AOS95119.2 ANTAR domain protein [Mycobacterium intracellulare subsp. chimaera]KPN48680.1 ANTAR domain protein [Mycobacterium intracellulare subsp. chimaera]MCA2322817.1 GAF and ANTAR domain-containing protein [Mycobacterium intracellulare]MCA2343322.1 GAF and ANTAR domain-containing protein [Mycobacterium intracellulare]
MAGKNGDPLTTPKDDAAAKNIRAAMAELATNFATHTDLIPILEAVTAQAVQLISAVDIAGILLIDGERHQALASTAPLAAELGIAQLDLREGPCLDAISNQPLVHCADFARDSRWSRFAAAALTADIHSMMSFHLYSHPKTHGELGGRGALNLFSRKANSFTLADQAVGAMLATHAATALIAANKQIQFDSALASRDVLGQAKGILMERFKVDAVRAFEMMAKLSQDTNTPVRVIAQRIVETI